MFQHLTKQLISSPRRVLLSSSRRVLLSSPRRVPRSNPRRVSLSSSRRVLHISPRRVLHSSPRRVLLRQQHCHTCSSTVTQAAVQSYRQQYCHTGSSTVTQAAALSHRQQHCHTGSSIVTRAAALSYRQVTQSASQQLAQSVSQQLMQDASRQITQSASQQLAQSVSQQLMQGASRQLAQSVSQLQSTNSKYNITTAGQAHPSVASVLCSQCKSQGGEIGSTRIGYESSLASQQPQKMAQQKHMALELKSAPASTQRLQFAAHSNQCQAQGGEIRGQIPCHCNNEPLTAYNTGYKQQSSSTHQTLAQKQLIQLASQQLMQPATHQLIQPDLQQRALHQFMQLALQQFIQLASHQPAIQQQFMQRALQQLIQLTSRYLMQLIPKQPVQAAPQQLMQFALQQYMQVFSSSQQIALQQLQRLAKQQSQQQLQQLQQQLQLAAKPATSPFSRFATAQQPASTASVSKSFSIAALTLQSAFTADALKPVSTAASQSASTTAALKSASTAALTLQSASTTALTLQSARIAAAFKLTQQYHLFTQRAAATQQLTQRTPAAQQLQQLVQNGSGSVSGSSNGCPSLTGDDELHQILRQHHSADITTRILHATIAAHYGFHQTSSSGGVAYNATTTTQVGGHCSNNKWFATALYTITDQHGARGTIVSKEALRHIHHYQMDSNADKVFAEHHPPLDMDRARFARHHDLNNVDSCRCAPAEHHKTIGTGEAPAQHNQTDVTTYEAPVCSDGATTQQTNISNNTGFAPVHVQLDQLTNSHRTSMSTREGTHEQTTTFNSEQFAAFNSEQPVTFNSGQLAAFNFEQPMVSKSETPARVLHSAHYMPADDILVDQKPTMRAMQQPLQLTPAPQQPPQRTSASEQLPQLAYASCANGDLIACKFQGSEIADTQLGFESCMAQLMQFAPQQQVIQLATTSEQPAEPATSTAQFVQCQSTDISTRTVHPNTTLLLQEALSNHQQLLQQRYAAPGPHTCIDVQNNSALPQDDLLHQAAKPEAQRFTATCVNTEGNSGLLQDGQLHQTATHIYVGAAPTLHTQSRLTTESCYLAAFASPIIQHFNQHLTHATLQVSQQPTTLQISQQPEPLTHAATNDDVQPSLVLIFTATIAMVYKITVSSHCRNKNATQRVKSLHSHLQGKEQLTSFQWIRHWFNQPSKWIHIWCTHQIATTHLDRASKDQVYKLQVFLTSTFPTFTPKLNTRRRTQIYNM